MIKHKVVMFWAVLMLFFISGCAHSLGNKRITDKDLLSQVKLGVSTKENVRSLFGDPEHKMNKQPSEIPTNAPVCKEFWDYIYFKKDGPKFQFYSVHFCFDKNDVLHLVSQYHSEDRPKGKEVEIGRKIDPSLWNMIVEGKTTEAEVIELLGEPQRRTIDSNATKTYGYVYKKAIMSSPSAGSLSEIYTIEFDKSGLVSSLSVNKSGPKESQK